MADLPTAPPNAPPPPPRRGARRLVTAGALLLLVLLVLQVPLPMYVLNPGPVFPLAGVVSLEGPAGETAEPITGDYLFTTIQLDDADVLAALGAAFDRDAQVLSRVAVLGDQDEASFVAEQAEAFDAAEVLAVRLGLDAVDSDVRPGAVDVDAAGVGGPSAGLLIALAVADLVSGDDLARGRLVAGTGTVDAAGTVGQVGSVADKVRAAEAAGADVFIVQDGQATQARAAAAEMEVIGVTTVAEAVGALLDR